MMNQYPAKPMMDQMAQYGRYGDSMLVHMNPVEVAGIASLSPTGSLTINPVTGQPEAFLPLLFGALGGAMGLGTIGTAALTGIGTAAVTGDLKRGLISGLTAGFASGLGEGIGSLFDSGTEAVTSLTDAATTGADVATGAADATTAGLDLSNATLAEGFVPPGGTDFLAQAGMPPSGLTGAGGVSFPTESAIGQQLATTQGNLAQVGNLPPVDYGAKAQEIIQQSNQAIAPAARTPNMSDAIFGRGEEIAQAGMGKLGGTGQFVAASTGQSMLEQMDVQEDFERAQRARMEEAEKKRGESYADLQSGYRAAQPGLMGGPSPYRSMMSRRTAGYALPGMYAAEGGQMPAMAGGGEVPGYVVGGSVNLDGLMDYYRNVYNGLRARGDETVANLTFEQFVSTLFSGVGETGASTGTANSEIYEQRIQALMDRGMTREQAIANQDAAISKGHDLNNDGIVTDDEHRIMTQPLEIEPTEQEAAALARARRGALGEYDQGFLEDYYNRYEQARQEREKRLPKEDQIDLVQLGVFNPATFGYLGQGLAGIDPVGIQAGLRGKYAMQAPIDYMYGFEPEFQSFQDDPLAPYIPTRAFRPTRRGVDPEKVGASFDPILDRENYLTQLREYYRTLASYGLGTRPPEDEPVDEASPETPQFEVVEDVFPEPVVPKEPPRTKEPSSGGNGFTVTEGTQPTATATPSEDYVDPVQAALDYRPSEGEYARAAQYKDIDPLLHSRRSSTQMREFLRGSRQDVSMEDFLSALQQAKGQYGQGMTYDPTRGLFSNISEEELARHREAQSVPFFIDPSQMTDVERTRAKMMGNKLGGGQEVAIGDRMYFLDNGNISSYQFRMPEGKFPTFRREGGITDIPEEAESAPPPRRADTVALRTPLGEVQTPAGGIAEVDNQFSATPSEEEIMILAQAVLGRAEEADSIINAFTKKYGNEVFAIVRDMILKSVMPEAQTEGMIAGNGSGMDDAVPGMIGDQQPVAVSPGEFIVPADVVSGLGDGSSDAGADELYAMMDRVRRARGGNGDQPPAIDARRSMPA